MRPIDGLRDYYEILQVHPRAGQEVIQRAYRTLSRMYHPDANPPEKRAWAQDMMSRLNEAYRVLSDPEKRREYDARGAENGSSSLRNGQQRKQSSVSAAVRSCHWHPQRARVSICTVCGRSICAECRRTDGMAVVCPDCQGKARPIVSDAEPSSRSKDIRTEGPRSSGVAAGLRELRETDGLNQAAFGILHLAIGTLALGLWIRGFILLIAFRFPGSLHLVWPLAISVSILGVAAIGVVMTTVRAYRWPMVTVLSGLIVATISLVLFYDLRSQPYAELGEAAMERGHLNEAITNYSAALWVYDSGKCLRQALGVAYLDAFVDSTDGAGENGSRVLATGALRYLSTESSAVQLTEALRNDAAGPPSVVVPERLVAVYLAARRLRLGGTAETGVWTRAVDVLAPSSVRIKDLESLGSVHRLTLGLALYELSKAAKSLPRERLSSLNRIYQRWIWETVTRKQVNDTVRGAMEETLRDWARDCLKDGHDELRALPEAIRRDYQQARRDLFEAEQTDGQASPDESAPDQLEKRNGERPVPDASGQNVLPLPPKTPGTNRLSPAAEAQCVGNSQSRVYHQSGCQHLPAPENQIAIWSSVHARSENYKPCSHCRPDEIDVEAAGSGEAFPDG